VAEVLRRAAAYVTAFHRQLSTIVSEETYDQSVIYTSRVNNGLTNAHQRLRADLILVTPPDADRFVELRDVFEVNGHPVRDREARLEQLLRTNSPDARPQIQTIIDASARHNIGSIQRNINTPVMALHFLQAEYQPRFTFRHVTKGQPVFTDPREQALNEAGVFRASTEMWTIEYRERRRNTIIRRPNGDDLPARGRFWINPETGAVLISELITDGGGVMATITVSYQSEPVMGFLVPVEMRESYIRTGERISGHAVYGRFRLLR
jgi:hypothetical protein